jgi:replicative DNA helicase
MRLSAPIHQLKRKARLLSRQENIPLHAALNRVASREGFSSWSLLAAKIYPAAHARDLFAKLSPGDLLLVGSRPGHGKTLMSLRLAVEAMKAGNHSAFFTLEYKEKDVTNCFYAIGAERKNFVRLFEFDGSDDISADYIVKRLASSPRGTLVVVDYLQLLDQKRQNPELMAQLCTLRSFASDKGLIFVFLSQVDRSYDPEMKQFPDLDDVKMPNPLDLSLFSKTLFLNNGEVRFAATN